MKTVTENYVFNIRAGHVGSAGPIEAALLTRIGDDLRCCYAELTDSDLPHRLLALAEAIDRRRAGERFED